MPSYLCCGLQTHRLLLSGTQEASLPPGVRTACFPGLISLTFKEGAFQGDALQRASLHASPLSSKFGPRSLLLQWSSTVCIEIFPFYNMLWTGQLKCSLALDEHILHQISRIRF